MQYFRRYAHLIADAVGVDQIESCMSQQRPPPVDSSAEESNYDDYDCGDEDYPLDAPQIADKTDHPTDSDIDEILRMHDNYPNKLWRGIYAVTKYKMHYGLQK